MKEKRTLTITQALAELKMLGKRIEDAINTFIPVGISVGKKGVVQGYKTNEEHGSEVKGKWDQINQLINNRDNIKAEIVRSNAETDVKIGNETMKVATAIERKVSIENDKKLLQRMKQVLQAQNTAYERQLQILNNKKDEINNSSVASDKGSEEVKSFLESQIALVDSLHTPTLHDPLNLKEKIKVLEEKIIEFETNVDYVLSVSNATTQIEVDV